MLQVLQRKGDVENSGLNRLKFKFLRREGIRNSIIAPSMIPRVQGKSVKTDCLDEKIVYRIVFSEIVFSEKEC